MKLRKYTKEDLIKAISGSLSFRSALSKLGITPAGGNYTTFKKAIAFFELDISHFTGKAHLRGKTHTYRLRSLEEILVFGKHENTYQLKSRILTSGLKEHKCEGCSRKNWLGKPIPLELHHKDGNRINNLIENLSLLCPNCHALTTHYRGRAQARAKNTKV